jgi:hypothetical protein
MTKKYLDKGENLLSRSSIIICSIVRDCAENLQSNIPVINALCDLAKNYQIIIFENDSKDKTKLILDDWANSRKDIYINIKNFNVDVTIPKNTETSLVNPFYSKQRIDKMVFYRNQYLNLIENNNLFADFIIIVDLDVASISLNGILDSFGQEREWDAISANGYSTSPKLSRRYHDTYALVEYGMQNIPQTEKSIIENQYKFSFLKKNIPLIPVYSAYGGLVIYRYEVINGLRYTNPFNNDEKVEVRCEHFGLNQQIQALGFNKFYINPNMEIKYQKLSLKIIFNTLKRSLNFNSKSFN